MKQKAFDIVSGASVKLIYASDWVFDKIGAVIVFLAEFHRRGFATVGMILMNLIDKERVEHAEKQIEARATDLELKLLNAAIQVRDHAEQSDWTDQHSEAIEAVGNALLNDCGWDDDSVHFWLKELVETIPGLNFDSDIDMIE